LKLTFFDLQLPFLGGLVIRVLKGIVQRILRGVNNKLKKSVLVNWRAAHFSF
jgi:hypothetical protein